VNELIGKYVTTLRGRCRTFGIVTAVATEPPSVTVDWGFVVSTLDYDAKTGSFGGLQMIGDAPPRRLH